MESFATDLSKEKKRSKSLEDPEKGIEIDVMILVTPNLDDGCCLF